MAYVPPTYGSPQYETRPVNFGDRDGGDEYPAHSVRSPDVATTLTGHTSGVTVPYSGEWVRTCTRYSAHMSVSLC